MATAVAVPLEVLIRQGLHLPPWLSLVIGLVKWTSAKGAVALAGFQGKVFVYPVQ
jgi:hypothetical protein